MALTSALNVALSGLRVNQRDLSITAGNISNAGVEGYSRRRLTFVDQNAADVSLGARTRVTRELDTVVQSQMRSAAAALSYAEIRSESLAQLDQLFGQPGAEGSLDKIINQFGVALDQLATSPDDRSFQLQARQAALEMVNALHEASSTIQDYRSQTEQTIGDRVERVNELLVNITDMNSKIQGAIGRGDDLVSLEDARDQQIDELSQIMDVRVLRRDDGSVAILSSGGASLLDMQPTRLEFDGRGSLGPASVWKSDPLQRGVGTIVVRTVNGHSFDLIADGQIRSGELAGHLEVRDKIMVEAQNQMDALAAAIAGAFEPQDVPSVAASSGGASGFDLDLAAMTKGTAITLERVVNGQVQKLQFVPSTSAQTGLPSPVSPTAGERVIDIDMRAGAASIAAQIQAALGSGFSVTNPSGSTLRVLDDGAAATTDVTALRITDPVLRLFTDNGPAAYAGSTTASALRTGFASRITVNPEAMGDSRAFVAWTPGSPVADPTRPTRMADRFRTERFTFGSDTGLGTGANAFSGTAGSFLRQVVTQRGAQAESAARVAEGQQIVMNNLAERRQDKSGVDIDTEMARLITIQNAYAANARVMTAVRDLFDILMRV